MSSPNNSGTVQGGITGAQGFVSVIVANYGDVALQLVGTFSATVQFEATVDNTTWVSLALTPSAGGSAVTSATAPGLWQGVCGGYYAVRARCSAFTSGTIYVAINASSRLLSNQVTVEVAADGALSGDGSLGDPLAVIPDGVTVDVNGSNQLEVIADIPAIDATFLTATDETGTLTGSRQLVDGTNTTIDVTTPGQIKVNASAGFDPDADETITGSWVFAPDTAGGKDPVTFAPALGAQLIVGGNWTVGAGWTQAPTGTFTHTPGQSADLTNTFSAVVGQWYQVSIHQASGTTGSIAVSLGGSAVLGFSGSDGAVTQTNIVLATTTDGLVITPDDDTYDGAIAAISVKEVPFAVVVQSPLGSQTFTQLFADVENIWNFSAAGILRIQFPGFEFNVVSNDGFSSAFQTDDDSLYINLNASGTDHSVNLRFNTEGGNASLILDGTDDTLTLDHDLVGTVFEGAFKSSDSTPGASNAGVVGATSTLIFKDGLFVGLV